MIIVAFVWCVSCVHCIDDALAIPRDCCNNVAFGWVKIRDTPVNSYGLKSFFRDLPLYWTNFSAISLILVSQHYTQFVGVSDNFYIFWAALPTVTHPLMKFLACLGHYHHECVNPLFFSYWISYNIALYHKLVQKISPLKVVFGNNFAW